MIPEVANEVAASAAAMAADPGTGHLAAEIVIPHTADAPAPSAPAAAAQSADAHLAPNTMSMTPGTINAHDSMVSTTTAPEAVDVLLPDADAQVPPDERRPMSQHAIPGGGNRSGANPPGEPMKSAKRIANRENSTKSTGPKTARGKARASRNALQHGLSAARVGDALVSAEAVRMAEAFGFEDMSRSQFEQFLIIAKCEVELDRVTAARIAIVERELARLAAGHQHRHVHPALQDGPDQMMRDEVLAFNHAAPAWCMLDRYERRALSRRRRAIVNFVACSIVEARVDSKEARKGNTAIVSRVSL